MTSARPLFCSILVSFCIRGTLPAQPLTQDSSGFEILDFVVDPSLKVPTASIKAHEAWKDERFGLFIHWGPISQLGRPLSHSRNSRSNRKGARPYKVADIEPEVYDIQYKTFNPVNFDPADMLGMAKDAGASYVVFTAKHHAGFSMFDSEVTDYDMMSTPYQKDITGMLAEASEALGLNFGIYYSPRDWYHPDCDSDENHDRYIEFYKKQMVELLTNYGPIHEVWFDGLGPGNWGNTAKEVMNLIRKLHPDAMVNNRGGAGADFYTPEHMVGYFNREQTWEACHTTTGQWGFNPNEGAKTLQRLMEILLYTWGGDGNILLNIGPTGDGSVNPVERERFEDLAEWWSLHGETSIRGSRGGPYLPGPWGVATCKEKQVFLHVFRWPEEGGLWFPSLKQRSLKSARVLSGGNVQLLHTDKGFEVQVPEHSRAPIVTTVALTFSDQTLPVTPMPRVTPLSHQATLYASHHQEKLPALQDQNAMTEWSAKVKDSSQPIWVEARFPQPVSVASFQLGRGTHWAEPKKIEFQVPNEDGVWTTVSSDRLKIRWEPIKFLDAPVTSDRFRILVTHSKKFQAAEFELYAPVGEKERTLRSMGHLVDLGLSTLFSDLRNHR